MACMMGGCKANGQSRHSSGIGRLTPPVNNGFTFERSTRAAFRFFSGGLGACPHLLDAIEEEVLAMLLVKGHGVLVA